MSTEQEDRVTTRSHKFDILHLTSYISDEFFYPQHMMALQLMMHFYKFNYQTVYTIVQIGPTQLITTIKCYLQCDINNNPVFHILIV